MKWEYKILENYYGNEFELNMLGNDGWEVVCANETYHRGAFRILLKRQKPEKQCST